MAAGIHPRRPGRTGSEQRAESWCLALICGAILLTFSFLGLYGTGPELGPWRDLLDPSGAGSVPSLFLALQLFLSGAIFLRLSRRDDRSCRPCFLVAIGVGFFLIAACCGLGWPGERLFGDGGFSAGPAGSIPPSLFLVGLCALGFWAGRRDLRSLWARFRQESEILLAGAWIFLVGSVGLQLMGELLLAGVSLPLLRQLEIAIRAFLKMSGCSVMLYGSLLLALRLRAGGERFTSGPVLRTGSAG